MKRRAAVLALLLSLLLGAACAAAQEGQRPEVLYFYENYCGSCTPDEDFYEEFAALTGTSLSAYRYLPYNTVQAAGKQALAEAIETYAIPEENQRLPLVIVDGTVYAGSTAIAANLPTAFLGDGDTQESLVYYLYVTACESCARAKQTLDALPDAVDITRGSVTFSSSVTVRPVDIGAELGLAQALFAEYGVPEEKQLAPIVLFGNRYLQGADAIDEQLLFRIRRGEATGTPVVDSARADTSALSFVGSVTAGLIAGLNPCALSMLLLFLSLIIGSQGNVGRLAAIFLGSKFVAYFLIGTAFLSLFQVWNPTWLPLATKLLLTAISIVFIVLNVLDAIKASREKYGEVRNQLPAGMRRGLQARIRAALENPKGSIVLAVCGLGFVVAAGEFLCAGQVYLATLLASIQSGEAAAVRLAQLAVYCLAFLTPSILISVLVARGKSAFALSEFMRRNMPLVKLVTAAFFVVMLAVVWLV